MANGPALVMRVCTFVRSSLSGESSRNYVTAPMVGCPAKGSSSAVVKMSIFLVESDFSWGCTKMVSG